MSFFNAVRISVKLPLVLVLLLVTAIAIEGVIAFQTAKSHTEEEARARLETVGELKARAILRFFEIIDRNLRINAANPETREAISAFAEAYGAMQDAESTLQRIYIDENPNPLGEKDKMTSAGVDLPYDRVHASLHPHFDLIQDEMGYYDVFLFDAAGNLIYSVFKERDYATNMNAGEWKDSGLAEVFRRAMQAGQGDPSVFVDFAAYAPSFDAPASFIARPVFNPAGEKIGVLAYQMPIDAINAVTGDIFGLGASGDAYLVGQDELMRTDSVATEGDDVLETRVASGAIEDALAGEAALGEFPDQAGNLGIWYARPVEFLGTTWAMVAKTGQRRSLRVAEGPQAVLPDQRRDARARHDGTVGSARPQHHEAAYCRRRGDGADQPQGVPHRSARNKPGRRDRRHCDHARGISQLARHRGGGGRRGRLQGCGVRSVGGTDAHCRHRLQHHPEERGHRQDDARTGGRFPNHDSGLRSRERARRQHGHLPCDAREGPAPKTFRASSRSASAMPISACWSTP